jgi:hypothetical protein
VRRRQGRGFGALAVTLICLLYGGALEAMVSLCGEARECVCITWISGGSATVEVRCPTGGAPSGWSGTGNPGDADGSSGSYGGSGNPKAPPSPLPGMPLNTTTSQKVSSAKSEAINRLRGEHIVDDGTGKGTWVPTECTDLFLNSPLGKTGAQLLSNYIVFRDGTGLRDSAGRTPCSEGAAAWTTCCTHDPVVYICPSQFNAAGLDARVKYLIHEALHVGGQQEDQDTTVGPGDPPNSSQINNDVAAACP